MRPDRVPSTLWLWGFWLYTGGIATRAAQEAVALVFEQTSAARVLGITDARNVQSVRLLQRVGMRMIESRDTVFREQPCIEHVYAISR